MDNFAYRLDDQIWPPMLHEIRGIDPETDLVIVSPINNPNRVIHLYREDLWIIA